MESASTQVDTLFSETLPGMNESGQSDGKSSEALRETAGTGKQAPEELFSIEEVSEYFPHLEIIEHLGRGGMGTVYKARQPTLDRVVALKLLSCEPKNHDAFSLRFEQEARVLARLHHPGIVTLFDFGSLERRKGELPLFFFMMEYVEGRDLQRVLDEEEISPVQSFDMIAQAAEALHFAHGRGVLHRDIKPANLLLSREGKLKVADFGVAKLLPHEDGPTAQGLTVTGTTVGTPFYMAPEMWDHPESADPRTDVYSAGMVLYHLLSGRRPSGHLELPSKIARLPRWADTPVTRSIAPDPEGRYESAEELAADARGVADRLRNLSRSRRIRVAIVSALVVVASLCAIFFLPEEKTIEPAVVENPTLPAALDPSRFGRIYLHYAGIEQKDLVESVAARFEGTGFMVSKLTELDMPEKLPRSTEVRYFREPEEKRGAEGVLRILRGEPQVPHARLLYVYGYAERNRVNHFEIWLGRDTLTETESAGLRRRKLLSSWPRGRLKAAATEAGGEILHLSKAEAYDDFVSVRRGPEHWYALRDNGLLISSHPNHDRRYVESISGGRGGPITVVETGGEILFPGGEDVFPKEEFPLEISEIGVAQLEAGSLHAVALLEDGQVSAWGPRYRRDVSADEVSVNYATEKWPFLPDGMEGCIEVAACFIHAAALFEEGRVRIWGFRGEMDVSELDPYLPIRSIRGRGDSLMLQTSSNIILRWRLPRSSYEEGGTGSRPVLERVGNGSLLASDFYFSDEAGWESFSPDAKLDELLDSCPRVGPHQISGHPVLGEESGEDSPSILYWISPEAE